MPTTQETKKGRDSGKSATPTTQRNDTALDAPHVCGEARIDCRLMADHLGNTRQHVRELLATYSEDFRALGKFRFETGETNGRGRPEQYAMLNEDQCYLLLSYSRNTSTVRALKLKLVIAFREARERRLLADTQYLPGYHALHDEVMALAQVAHDHGSLASDDVFHSNANRLVNKAAGIGPGMRDRLSDAQRLMVVNLQAVMRTALRSAIAAGADHREAYRQAKDAALSFSQVAGRLLGGAQ